ncbi:MAG: DUF2911 domain-containing protein [Holophagales bacterium]|jgi:hypothetical protein|nr:DUF2911 domain-containing protein [Holophagales bacterium]
MNSTGLLTALLALTVGGWPSLSAQETQKTQDTQQMQEAPRLPRVATSPKASVVQRIGLDTDITIVYSRPGVKGRKIWGELVPYGLAPANQYAPKPFPWRAGANATTTIEFSGPVKIQGKELSAGKYGLHMIPDKDKDWIIIFSKNSSGAGSFKYMEDEDALRVTAKPVTETTFTEWLEFGFENLSATGATCYLRWEKLKIPFELSL